MASPKESKIMQETGQPEDATADTEGESIEDEIVKRFYQEIFRRDERSTSFEDITSSAKRYSLINSVSEHCIEDGTSATALSYAIHHESHSIVQQILDDLKVQPRNIQMAPIVETDDDGNNALQKLIKTIEYRAAPLPTENVAPKVKTILSTFLKFDLSLLKHENNTGETALTQALMCTKYTARGDTLFTHMMDDIPDNKDRIEAIREKQTKCSSDGCMSEGKSGHVPGCTEGYNLLMLALTSGNLCNIDYLVNIVCDADVDSKLEILIGDRDRKLSTYVPNSIRVAAKYEQWKALEYLLESIANVDTTNLVDVLIDEDERLDSAMKWIVRAEGTAVETLLKLSDSKLRHEMNVAFQSNIDRNKFMKLEMSVESIKAFHDADLFVDSFLLPKPSSDKRFSRPHAIICYNAFKLDKGLRLVNTRIGAEAMQKALNSLGWEIKSENLISGWSFTELMDKVKNQLNEAKHHASICLLCVTTHGEDNKIAGEKKEVPKGFDLGHINEIVRVVEDCTEPSIPKVIIIETCRDEPEPEPEPIMIPEKNVLLLMATSYRQMATAGLYLGALADEIENADGATTLEEMHYNATKNITKMKHESGNKQVEDDGDDGNDGDSSNNHDVDGKNIKFELLQYPQKYSTAGRITLRNWNPEIDECRDQRHKSPVKCGRCHKNVCLTCIEFPAGSDVLQHRNVRLYCNACCEIVD